jgi:uncharacterized protein (TIGR02453 family)
MSDALIPTAMSFLRDLAARNEKDWWEANRDRYQQGLKAPAEALLAAVAGDLARTSGHGVTTKLFRPYRDVRFSKDKTPYHTHLHMMWTLAAGGRQDPGLFFGINPEGAFAGYGVFQFDPPVLADWRRMLELDTGRITGAVAAAEAGGFELWGEALKRPPAPFAPGHPAARLSCRKGLVLMRGIDAGADPRAALGQVMEALQPVSRVLDSIL